MGPKYSICSTSYNSVATVNGFVKPLLNLGSNYEIIIVDNCSSDGTFEKLNEYGSELKILRSKCSRGRGRQIAMNLAKGKTIIHVDFDVGYKEIEKVVEFYEKTSKSSIYYIKSKKYKCNACIYIGEKYTFDLLNGFPDLNHADDTYFNKKTSNLNMLETITMDIAHDCLDINGLSSGAESRYERTFLRKAIRRILATRDILFVNHFTFSDIMEKYKLKGLKKYTEGMLEYLLGKLLIISIKVPSVEKEVKDIKESQKYKLYLNLNNNT